MTPGTPQNTRSYTHERVFADAKQRHGMRYTHHRGQAHVSNWVRLKFTAMNLKSWPDEKQDDIPLENI